MRFGVTLVVHSWPPSSAFQILRLTNWGGLRDPELNPAAHPSSPGLIGVRPASEGPRMSSHQSTRAEWRQWFTLRESLFLSGALTGSHFGLVVAVSAALSLSLSLSLALVLTRTPVSWLYLPSPHLPLSLLPPSNPVCTHTQLLFPARFIRFDTPHPPAIVRTRKGRMGLFVGTGLDAFVCECGSKLRATAASTTHLLSTWTLN